MKKSINQKSQGGQAASGSQSPVRPDPVEVVLHHKAAKINPGRSFVERLSARLRRERQAKTAPARRRIPLWGWGGATVAALLIIAFVAQVLLPHGPVPAVPGDATQIAQAPPTTTITQPTTMPTEPATAEATPVSTPTAEPEPAFAADLPPAIASAIPRPGEEVNTQASILLRFTQPMDRASVEQALRVASDDVDADALDGTFTWESDQTVTFKPKGLASGVRYQVSVGIEARATNGLLLTQDLAFTFSTVGPLTVTRTTPADKVQDLRGDAPVVVAFNYPLVPVNCTGQVAEQGGDCAPLPLNFTPGIVGQGMWVNTSVYRFDPLPGWEAGVTYTAEVPAGVVSVSGAVLDTPVSWAFTTAPPRVLDITPDNGATNVPPDTGIRVSFNTPMGAHATETAFSLTNSQGQSIPGTFQWEDNNTTFVFTPTQQLALGTRQTIRLSEAAQTVNGTPLDEGRELNFTTAPLPSVLRITGTNEGSSRVLDFYESLRVQFVGLVDGSTVPDHISLTENGEAVDDFNVWWNDYDVPHAAYVHWDKTPGAEACLTVLPGIIDIYSNTINTETSACFTNEDMPGVFTIASTQDTLSLDAADPARFYFVTVNTDAADLTLTSQPEQGFVGYEPRRGDVLRRWTVTPSTPLNETRVLSVDLTEDGGPLPTGYYALSWLGGSAENRYRTFLRFAVVDRHVTLKMGADEALVWVTDLRTAQPIAEADVHLLSYTGQVLGSGLTDADGIARFTIPLQPERWNTYLAVTGTPGQPGFGVTRSDWNENINPWAFDILSDYGQPIPYRAYLHIDRPIYRPGQAVYFRGILRVDDDARYRLPTGQEELRVKLFDAMSNVIGEITPELSGTGIFDGQFVIPEDASLGAYSLNVDVLGTEYANWSTSFTVAAYRKPEFEVLVTPEQADVIQGDLIHAQVTAQYYAGGPTSNARVHWTLRAIPYSFEPGIPGWWNWGHDAYGWDWWRDPDLLAEGDTILDVQGAFLWEWPADLAPLGDADTAGPQRWTLEVTVTDETGFPVTGRGELTVHTGRFYIGLKSRSWVAQAGKEALVDLLALDWEERPVAGRQVDISLARRIWKMIPAREPYASPTWVHTDTVESTLSVTTDVAGRAEVPVTPAQSGSYVVIVESADADHMIQSETYLWVAGDAAATWQQPENQVKPVADAQSYKPGDIARILLPTSFAPPYEVLMTVERESFLDVRRITVQETNPLIEVPITDAYVPNVVVSFVAVKGVDATTSVPDVRIGMVELNVEPVKQLLTVEVIPDCPADQSPCTYEPRSTVALTVRTRDVNGAPVSADVALAVVDKAVLALADPNAPSMRDTFYGARALNILTGNGLVALFNRSAVDLEVLAQQAHRIARQALYGGIGGGGGGGAVYMADVRQDYPDTALWEARLRTDANGEAHVTLQLPDSLTTWVADARAVTDDTRVGQGTVEFMVGKPLYVRPVTPRFFTAGDKADVAAVVQNNTDTDLDVTVSLETNLSIIDQQGATRAINVPAQGRAQVSWKIEVPVSDTDFASLTFAAEGGGYRDAARPTVGRESDHALPIYRYEAPDVYGTSGALTEAGSRLEAIVVPPEAGADSTLTVRIEPTLASGLTEQLTYLEHFEHECTEQLISRFLPNVVTYQALRDLGVPDTELETRLAALVADALSQLYARQNPDGSWGWWPGSPADFQTSIYAALGLIKAQQAGFPVQQDALDRAVTYIQRSLTTGLKSEARTLIQAFGLYVLSEGNYAWPEGAEALFEARDRLNVTGRAYLVLALGIKDPSDTRVATLLDDLKADAEITASGAHWEGEAAQYWVTWTRTTAIVVDALARLAPDDPLLPQAVRWLMVARGKDRWQTTQEIAWGVVALTDYMVATGELQADYVWGLALNTAPLDEGQVTPETLREPVETTIPVNDLLREWPNALEISRSEGEGTLYYTANLAIYRPADTLSAENRGIDVIRQYCAPASETEEMPQPFYWDADFGPCEPVTSVRPGDTVEVRLTLVLPRMRNYLLVEDFYPAGMEPVNPELETEVQEDGAPETHRISKEDAWWWPTFDHQELRDERAVFYATRLYAGTYQVRYTLRAAIPGEYRVLPATASEMYFPEVWGRSEGILFTVEP